jgi:hypothetical protein
LIKNYAIFLLGKPGRVEQPVILKWPFDPDIVNKMKMT